VEFRCRVATATGQISEATYVADNESRLRRDLEAQGLYVLSARRAGAMGLGSMRLGLPQRRRVATPEFLLFNQELATLLKAGLPLVQSLDILRRRVPNPVFKAALNDIHERVRSGTPLSEAFDAQGLFSPVYTASLMAGEKSGSLDQVLRRYVEHTKVVLSARSQVVSALVYPVILLLLSAAVVGLIVFRVVPEFAAFYGQFGEAELPFATRIVVAISENVLNSAGLILVVLAALVAGAIYWWRRPGQKRRMHAALLRVPYFGTLARRFATAQTSRTLATLLYGGIPLVTALDIAARASGNEAIGRHLESVADDVRQGRSLATALADRDLFPHVAVEMVEVGESTGALADMLASVADFYDEENQTSLTRFSNAVQPALLIVMGFVIAGLLLSLYMPLFRLSSLVS